MSTAGATGVAGAAISVQGVSKHYRDVVALDRVRLDIRAGEFLTLLGASGSGKSTLLNIIAGFVPATEGTIRVADRDLTRVPPQKRDLGMVFQHYALFPHMNVFDNVAFPLRRRRVRKDEVRRRVLEALDTVELAHLVERRPSELSGGQQQRVAFARAIVFHPSVLLMDEPLGALDKRLREQLQLEIKRLHRELGITFVFVTHDQQEALAMSDRIALLRDGRVVQVGEPTELYERPAERYTAEFLGESNVFVCDVRDGVCHDAPTGRMLHTAGRVPGTRADVVVRPEKLRLLPAGTEPPAASNALTATVRETIYLGSEFRSELVVDDGRVLVVRVPASEPPPTPGASVVVTWDADAAVVLPADGAANDGAANDGAANDGAGNGGAGIAATSPSAAAEPAAEISSPSTR
ncbi:ABC transporter ATP-binding protein [Egicoccus halophilus]|uniref:Spermidine/putrescine import ATP-binding protein PotA n=1 Tax=Egicoccus halophilus TaxID=1670830 RepID=A0A8J3AB34_9ACTN|nr:ABC transporter ATP-binding protein [Egicoccus halophilus]GGI07007.1 polyamine-transporting ATPase [Egicoccus halophilus]